MFLKEDYFIKYIFIKQSPCLIKNLPTIIKKLSTYFLSNLKYF